MKIKNSLLALSGMMLFGTSAPVFAADVIAAPELSPFSAVLDGWAGGLFIDDTKDTNPDHSDLFVFGADGRVRFDLSDAFSVQADASIDDTDKNNGFNFYQGGWHAGGHLNWNNPDSGLLGVFGGIGAGASDEDNTDFSLIGGEAQLYFDTSTLYLQGGYFDAHATSGPGEDAFHNAWFGRLVGRYFLSPESRLQAEVSYASGKQDTDNQHMDIVGWGVRVDHQLFENVGIFAAYDGGYYDNGNGSDTAEFFEHQVRAGVSISLGRPDLLTTDRKGPNLDMPWVTHWAASGNSVD